MFDVDVKVFNEPTRLFSLMHAIISSHDGWETLLAPRIVLGLWHPRFLKPAEKLLPYCRRSHIGISPRIAKQYFWDSCDSFSMAFSALATMEGDTCVKVRLVQHEISLTLFIPSVGSDRFAKRLEEADGVDR